MELNIKEITQIISALAMDEDGDKPRGALITKLMEERKRLSGDDV